MKQYGRKAHTLMSIQPSSLLENYLERNVEQIWTSTALAYASARKVIQSNTTLGSQLRMQTVLLTHAH